MTERRVLAIIGRPGSGKSSVVREYLNRFARDWEMRELPPLLKAHVSPALNLSILGDYSDTAEIFPGTDRLSMAAAPEMLRWMKASSGHVLFEGDRFGNVSTLRQLSLMPIKLRIICLHAPDYELTRRYMLRGSAQSRKVLQARETKVANICINPNLLVRMRVNINAAHKIATAIDIHQFLTGGE